MDPRKKKFCGSVDIGGSKNRAWKVFFNTCNRKKLVVKNRWIHRKKLALKIFGGSVDPPWIHGKKNSVDRWTSVDQKIELGKYSSIHVKKIQRIEKSVDPQKKTCSEKSVDPQKKTCFSNFRWIGGPKNGAR